MTLSSQDSPTGGQRDKMLHPEPLSESGECRSETREAASPVGAGAESGGHGSRCPPRGKPAWKAGSLQPGGSDVPTRSRAQ